MTEPYNIFETANFEDDSRPGGLSLRELGPLNGAHRGRVCVEGEIVYMGCATGPNICNDVAFDYGIRVRRVLNYGGITVPVY